MPPPADQQRCVPRRDVTLYLSFGGKGVKRSDERQACTVSWRCLCLRVVTPRPPVEELARELCSERTGVFSGGKRRFYPTAAGQKSDEERLDFLVLLRFVRLSFAPSLCLLEFEPLVVTLEETLVCWVDCSFRSACSHLSGLTVSLVGQNVGHPATRPAEALAGGSGGQRPIPGAGVD